MSAEDELRWFFNDAPSAMGLQSSYPAMIRRLLLPGDRSCAPTAYEVDETVLDAAYRARRIRRVLVAAGEEVAEVLRACFTLPVPRKLKAYGVGAAIVPNLQVTLNAYRASGDARSIEEWLARLHRAAARNPEANRSVGEITVAASRAYRVALVAYAESRRRVALWR